MINAGSADAIPAINQASPSLLLVGKPIYFEEVAHQAKTGIENAAIARINTGIKERRYTPKTKSSEPAKTDNRRGIEKITPNNNTTAKTPQTCLNGGKSNTESSRVMNL